MNDTTIKLTKWQQGGASVQILNTFFAPFFFTTWKTTFMNWPKVFLIFLRNNKNNDGYFELNTYLKVWV